MTLTAREKTAIPEPMEKSIFKSPESIADQVYEHLKEKIITGALKSGERLVESELALILQTSRTPIREAFRRLEQDFLIERIPSGGVRVTVISYETVQEVLGIRTVLESYAVELACQNIGPENIAHLREITGKARFILEAESLDLETRMSRIFRLNSDFHETIYRSAGSDYLVRIINNLRNSVLRLRALGVRQDRVWKDVWAEHEELIDHLEEGDVEKAMELVKVHLANAYSHVVAEMAEDDALADLPD